MIRPSRAVDLRGPQRHDRGRQRPSACRPRARWSRARRPIPAAGEGVRGRRILPGARRDQPGLRTRRRSGSRSTCPPTWNSKADDVRRRRLQRHDRHRHRQRPRRPDRQADAARPRLCHLRQRLRPPGRPRRQPRRQLRRQRRGAAQLRRRRPQEDARRRGARDRGALRRQAAAHLLRRRLHRRARGADGGRQLAAGLRRRHRAVSRLERHRAQPAPRPQ